MHISHTHPLRQQHLIENGIYIVCGKE